MTHGPQHTKAVRDNLSLGQPAEESFPASFHGQGSTKASEMESCGLGPCLHNLSLRHDVLLRPGSLLLSRHGPWGGKSLDILLFHGPTMGCHSHSVMSPTPAVWSEDAVILTSRPLGFMALCWAMSGDILAHPTLGSCCHSNLYLLCRGHTCC